MTLTLDAGQNDGAKFLSASAKAYLADVPGYGKTPQAIVAAHLVGARHIIVVCPASAVPVWQAHFTLCWESFAGKLTIISYDTAIRRKAALLELAAQGLDVLIVDEAHRVKNPLSKRTALVLGTRREKGLAHHAAHIWLLSGTPTPNGPHEWWTPLARLWPERLIAAGIKTEQEWLDQLFDWYVGKFGPVVKRCRDPRRLGTLLHDIVLRRELDVSQLPPIVVRELPIEVKSDAEGMTTLLEIEAECAEAFGQLDEGELPLLFGDDNDKVPIGKLRHAIGRVKAPLAAQLVLDAARDGAQRQIVFAHHLDVLDRIEHDVSGKGEGLRVLRVDGSVPVPERARRIAEFQSGASRPMVFLGQNDACKEAITLTASDRVLMVEPSWVPDDNVQLMKRAHRRGQTRPVLAQFLTLQYSLDKVIQSVLVRKAKANIEADRALRGELPPPPATENLSNGDWRDDFLEPLPA